ncbi:DNA repair protein RAD51 homolog 3 [Physcomitrium patens]|uniref:DNA repair protein RAD51 homolog 3 n=1 Tax=Physcomitrium patens TaxID=3218 RepID=A0A2K1KJF9_PHYPA|nr:DNA repair protein RAD51 homolog 3-like isoform X2 [Physcomitrium patens]PNR53903.1 hypothetical protein PHYPA_007578 [Physcomitrium patens]|eukprot:XP_024375721.1 DNA repair protein RAD51 homolog 3-like isoform X2 [Physcomitrella patens]
MDVLTLALPPSQRSKLLAAGFHTTAALVSVTPFQLSQEANITLEEATVVLKLVPRSDIDHVGALSLSGPLTGSTTAWDLLIHEKNRRKIGTGSTEVDKILGGGVLSKELTEICGVPGVGKTQFSMQLAVNVQIPAEFGGVGGHAIYIDTEGSFMMERVLQITEAVIDDLRNKSPASAEDLTVEDFLSHIYLLRVHDPVEQLAVVNTLPTLLDEHKEVRLVVFDSVTFNFRQDFEDMAGRTRLLANMAQKLMAVAENYDVAIVLVNQVTHKVTSEGSRTVPALGESWSHVCTNRLMVYWMDGQRYAHLAKSPSLPVGTAPYVITEEGVRDAQESHKRPKLVEPHG